MPYRYPVLGQPHAAPLPRQVARVAAARRGPRARTARGRASSRRCGSATRAGWRASRWSTSRTCSCGRSRGVADRVAWMIATVDAMARRARPRRDLPRAVDLRRRVRPPVHDHRARAVRATPCSTRSTAAASRAATTGCGRSTTTTTPSWAATACGGCARSWRGRWRGRAAADGGPLVFATEGGVRLSGVRRRYGVEYGPERQRAEQAAMLAQALTRYERTPGVGPVHAVHGDRGSGLRLRAAGGRTGGGRPAFAAWVA